MTTERTTDGLTSGSVELRRLNVAMLFAALAAFGLLYSTQALLPAIGADFEVSPTAASLTVSAATGALALAILPLSSLAESVGRVPVMRAGLLIACAFTFVAAAAPYFWLLLVARGLVGVALAAVVAVAVAHLGDEVHPAAVVNLASVAGQGASGVIGWYGVSKAALIHLTTELGFELGPDVRVNAVAPAVVKTKFAEALYEGREEKVARAYPMKRLGLPDDVAGAVSFLLSTDASWITGQTLTIDGGVTLGGAL